MKNQIYMIVFSALSVSSAEAQVDYFPKVPGAPVQSSEADACSPDGQIVVGGAVWTDGLFKPVRWTKDGGLEFLDTPQSGTHGLALAISTDGTVVAGSVNGFGATRWDNKAVSLLESLPGGPTFNETGSGVLPDGSVVVGSSYSANGEEATVWPVGATPYGLYSVHPTIKAYHATEMPAQNIIVGSAYVGGTIQAFRYKDGVMLALGDLPGGKVESRARDCSADGSVVVGESYSGTLPQAYFWTERTGMIGLGYFPTAPAAKLSFAYGVSADGWRVVGQSTHNPASTCFGGEGTPHAFVWDPIVGMRSLHDILEEEQGSPVKDHTLYLALDCSADGTIIVGEAINIPECRLVGYRAKIKPFCYADCDQSPGHKRTLDAFDFLCFIARFDQQDFYTDCDQNGEHDFFDLLCYINEFSKGCP